MFVICPLKSRAVDLENIQNVAKQHFEQRTSFNVLKIDVSIPLQNNNNNNNIHTDSCYNLITIDPN